MKEALKTGPSLPWRRRPHRRCARRRIGPVGTGGLVWCGHPGRVSRSIRRRHL